MWVLPTCLLSPNAHLAHSQICSDWLITKRQVSKVLHELQLRNLVCGQYYPRVLLLMMRILSTSFAYFFISSGWLITKRKGKCLKNASKPRTAIFFFFFFAFVCTDCLFVFVCLFVCLFCFCFCFCFLFFVLKP